MRTLVVALSALLVLAGCCCRPACCPPRADVRTTRPAPGVAATPAAGTSVAAAPAAQPARPPEPARGEPLAQAPATGTAPSPGKPLRVVLHVNKSLSMSGTAQVTLSNATSMTLDLYVDGGYGCRALRNLMCTTHVTPGTLTLEAKGPDGESASTTTTVGAGDSVTWTVTEE